MLIILGDLWGTHIVMLKKTKKVLVQKVNSLENHSESIGSMN